MQKTFMERVAGFIVDKRYLFILIFIGLCIMSIFTSNSVRVDEDLTNYLPDDSETRQGLAIMEREFITYGDARVMVSNITYAKAEELFSVGRESFTPASLWRFLRIRSISRMRLHSLR